MNKRHKQKFPLRLRAPLSRRPLKGRLPPPRYLSFSAPVDIDIDNGSVLMPEICEHTIQIAFSVAEIKRHLRKSGIAQHVHAAPRYIPHEGHGSEHTSGNKAVAYFSDRSGHGKMIKPDNVFEGFGTYLRHAFRNEQRVKVGSLKGPFPYTRDSGAFVNRGISTLPSFKQPAR